MKNKYKEALDNLEQAYIDLLMIGKSKALTDDELQSLLLPLHELVDRATPKKVLNVKSRSYQPFYDREDDIYGECPNKKCGRIVFKEPHKFCSECGQALDWSENE